MSRLFLLCMFMLIASTVCFNIKPRLLQTRATTKLNFVPESLQTLDTLSTQIFPVTQLISDAEQPISGYSSLSLYFTLALYVLSLPGLYSLITRSVKPSITRRTYDLPGPANPTAKSMRQIAGEVMAYFKALNYEVSAAEDVITFKGVMGRSNSQAAFLTFCTFMGLGSLALVLSILIPDLGAKAYAITLISPYAGIYYWNNAQRIDEISIKMEASDDEQFTTIVAQGDKEDLERFSKSLNLAERGKVYVKGLFDSGNEDGSSSTNTSADSSSTPIPVSTEVSEEVKQ